DRRQFFGGACGFGIVTDDDGTCGVRRACWNSIGFDRARSRRPQPSTHPARPCCALSFHGRNCASLSENWNVDHHGDVYDDWGVDIFHILLNRLAGEKPRMRRKIVITLISLIVLAGAIGTFAAMRASASKSA